MGGREWGGGRDDILVQLLFGLYALQSAFDFFPISKESVMITVINYHSDTGIDISKMCYRKLTEKQA